MTTPTGPETMRISLSVTDYSWPGPASALGSHLVGVVQAAERAVSTRSGCRTT